MLLVVKMYYINVKVVILKIEDVGLIYSIKWLIFFVFYFCGLCRNFLFILFYGNDNCEILYIKFWINRWIVSIGRNGINVLVISIEKILLKLELVVIFRYLMILLKVFCFLIMFFLSIMRFFFSRIIFDDFLVILVVLLMEIFIFVLWSVGVLLILFLRKLMVWLFFCSVCKICVFCNGVSWVNIVCFFILGVSLVFDIVLIWVLVRILCVLIFIFR